jgi:hypothetical protein
MDMVARIPDTGESPDHTVARTQMRTVLEPKVDELPEISLISRRATSSISEARSATALSLTS